MLNFPPGGDPFFPGLHGLICDNVKGFEVCNLAPRIDDTDILRQVVLSNSTIVRASATEYADLFVALKGGGPNFG